jgi:hypothetical protein
MVTSRRRRRLQERREGSVDDKTKTVSAGLSTDNRRDGRGTPDYLVPGMGTHDVAISEPAIYRSLFILDTVERYLALKPNEGKPPGGQQGGNQPAGQQGGNQPAGQQGGNQPAGQQGGNQPGGGQQEGKQDPATTLVAPIDPFDDKQLASEENSKPAVGVLMIHKQGWKQSGLALGNLLQSVCLAPGEVTRIAVTDWQRRESGTSSQTKEQGETVSSDVEQQRAVNEVQRAVANEAQSGGSSALSTSASAQAAAGVSTLFATANASAATSMTSALTAQFSAGARNLAATSTNAITTRTAEKSQALRSLRQTVVREVTQKEHETTTTRILANYNRRHSLNIEYFEVLQKYKIVTELAGWARCLFVPLQPLDLSKLDTLKKHSAELIAIVSQLGASDLAKDIMAAVVSIPKKEEEQKAALAKLGQDLPTLERIQALLRAILIDIDNLRNHRGGGGYVNLTGYVVLNTPAEVNRLIDSLPDYALPKLDIPNPDPTKLVPDELNRIQARVSHVQNSVEQAINRARTTIVPITELLNSARMFLSQMIWLRMDSYRIYRALAQHRIGGKALTALVDPHPIGVFGNYLAFRWGFGRDADDERKAFEREYLKQDDKTDDKKQDDKKQDDKKQDDKTDDKTKAVSAADEIALPTSGVFAEAVLGLGEAAEEIDADRFGKWYENQPPILPPEIDKLTSRDRSKEMSLSLGDFATALAQLRSSPLTDASHIGSIVSGVTKGDTFRNMGGLDHAIELAGKVAALAEKGATRAGDRNAEMQAKFLDTFVQVLNSDVGKAAVAEFMLPGAGPAVLKAATERGTVLPPPSATPKQGQGVAGGGQGQGAGGQGQGGERPVDL